MRRALFLLCGLLGCGTDVVNHPPTPTAVVSTPISVIISTGAKENVLVLFHDDAGVLLGSARTNAEGKASSPSTIAPTQVSVLIGQPTFHRIVTWTAVEPGDEILIDNPAPRPALGSFLVSLPGPFPNATSYSLRPSSAASNDPMAPLFLFGLPNGTFAAVLGQATTDSRPIAFAFAKDVNAPATAEVPLKLGPWVTPVAMSVDAANIPAEQQTRTYLVETIGEIFREEAGPPVTSDPNGKEWLGTREFLVAPGFADGYDVRAFTIPQAASFSGQFSKLVMQKHVREPGPVTFDFARALTEVVDAKIDFSEPLRPTTSWRSSATPTPNNKGPLATTADAGVIVLRWGSGSSSAGMSPDSGDWHLIVPPHATQVKAPILPPEAAAWLPLENQTSDLADVTFVDVERAPDYRAFRHDINMLNVIARAGRFTLREEGESRWTSATSSRF